MKKLFLTAFILAFQSAQAETINVADHGILPGTDVSQKVNELLASLKGKADITLVFPKGTYEFYPENAVEIYRAVTNHDNGPKRIAFPVFGYEDFTLEGSGSTFMFHGRMSPIVVEGSSGVILQNFSIDWETPFHHELKVLERNEADNSFVAEISPMKYGFEIKDQKLFFNHYDWQDEIGQNVAFDPKTNAPLWDTQLYQLRGKQAKATKLGENTVSLKNATKVPPPVGAVICTYGNAPTNRLAQAIHLDRTKNTRIENVTVYAAGGMALIAERSENIELDKVIVTSTDERTLATRADATHFLRCKGLVDVRNCRFEHMADDGINVHGVYIKINEYKGNRTFLCEINHRQQLGLIFAEAGDKVAITSRETVLPIYETTVEKVEIHDESLLSITVAEVPDDLPAGLLSMENLSWYPDLVFKNNVIRDNRARSALISTKGKVLVEDNVFSSQMHGILIEGDNNSWYESGGVRDITIQNNVFENIGYGKGSGYPLYISPLLREEQRLGDEKYHRNIRFRNNRLKSFNGLLVHGLSVEGLEITGNIVTKDSLYPKWSELPAIDLNYCEDITIEGNRFEGFDFPIRAAISEDTEEVKFVENPGIER
ncbi:right-handed parallel beta-helix repeat-containing protein [Luteolibacter algae]|uniref:Right-handed parallel beta-helix repeat-containing protein n=1 Tax=Luteolibacter algae TaxID=454151 RepID=A0ABW5D668_9BACT